MTGALACGGLAGSQIKGTMSRKLVASACAYTLVSYAGGAKICNESGKVGETSLKGCTDTPIDLTGDRLFPPIKWAQRADCVLITVDVPDCEDVKLNVDEEKNSLLFSCTAGKEKYSINMELWEKVVKDESSWNYTGRNVMINLSKKDKDADEWWPRTTKQKIKNRNIKVDFKRWMDKD